MDGFQRDVRVILIGGSSHSGKTTVGKGLAERLGWEVVSTDYIARHPGRPWKTAPEVVPGHVAEHYLTLPVEELVADVLRHYRVNIWPKVEAMVRERAASGGKGLVVEGSAVWPELVAGVAGPEVAGVWLTASDETFERRIRGESGYEMRDARGREMIDKFLARTVRFNGLMMEAVWRRGLESVRVEEEMGVEEVVEACLVAIRGVK